jgi:O-methyltransferase involved in polyketide biosynthesis
MPEATSRHEPPRFDPQTPNIARMYDYYLGGKDNFAADRAAAEQALALMPDMREGAAAVRAFLTRAVRYLVGEGIRQFVDLGCGLPTQGNVHEVAQSLAPDSRVAYVDYDPVVIAHARALLETNPLTAVIQGDVREPEALLADPELRELIDFDQPVAVLMIAVLHVIPDDEMVHHIVRTVRDAVVPGSYLAIAHAVSDLRPHATAKLASLYQNQVGTSGPRRQNLRSKSEVEAYFEELELVEPGLVYISEWRPEAPLGPDAKPVWAVGAVARKG